MFQIDIVRKTDHTGLAGTGIIFTLFYYRVCLPPPALDGQTLQKAYKVNSYAVNPPFWIFKQLRKRRLDMCEGRL